MDVHHAFYFIATPKLLITNTLGALNVNNPLSVDKTNLHANINHDKAGLLVLLSLTSTWLYAPESQTFAISFYIYICCPSFDPSNFCSISASLPDPFGLAPFHKSNPKSFLPRGVNSAVVPS